MDKIIKVVLEDPTITIDYDENANTMIVRQDICDLIRNYNILPFMDDDKLYFMDKRTMEIVSEFDRVKLGILCG